MLFSLGIFAVFNFVNAQAPWSSERVYYNEKGVLEYTKDTLHNRIPDFSYAGYQNGEAGIPNVPVVKTISPVEGDNTDHIQDALFEVALSGTDENGITGALLLEAGVYEISGTLKINFNGVVMRGVGDGTNPESNTVIKAVGNSPSRRTVLVAGGGGTTYWSDRVEGTRQDIVTDSVFVGDRTFEIEDASGYAVGDNIIVYHPCSEAWLVAVDSGGTHWEEPGANPAEDFPWSPGSQPIVFNRYIKDIAGNTITFGVPVYNHLIRELSQSYIYKYARYGIRTKIGIENMRIQIESEHPTDEDHAWNGIDLFQVEDAWVRNCTVTGFARSGVRTNTATRITVENVNAIEPASGIDGGRRYNFNAYTASQQILFKNCHANKGRHAYMSNGMSWTSGIVFFDCTSSGAYASSEGHRRWSMGLLYDNVKELDGPRSGYNPRMLGLYNRGYYGSSHGWGAAHSVAWNTDVADGYLIVQQPPTAQNYAIGCFGDRVTGEEPYTSFPEPEGYIEGTNTPGLEPRSLYLAQLGQRIDTTIVGIHDKDAPVGTVPEKMRLSQNFPNPFNAETNIEFSVNTPDDISLKVYDLSGREVATLWSGFTNTGTYTVKWDGTSVSSGVYLVRLQSNMQMQTRRMILLK